MPQDLTETIAKLGDRNLPKEEADALLASLADQDLRLKMKFQRHGATFGINVPEAYKDGQTLTGKSGQNEVQVLVPEADETAARALARDDKLSLVVRYLSFDPFYRRVTFTGSLPAKKEQPKTDASTEPKTPEPIPTPEPLAEVQPEPVAEPEIEVKPPPPSPPPEQVEPAAPTEAEDEPPPTDDPGPPSAEKVEPPARSEPPSPVAAKPKTGELAVFTSSSIPGSSGDSIAKKSLVRSSEIIADLAHRAQATENEAAMVVDGFWDYVAKVKQHYRKHVRAQTLVIPHFGSFSFHYHRGTKRVLDFKPSPEDWTIRGTSSSRWVDQWSGKPHGLSVRRRIAVFVAEQSSLPLKKVDAMLNQFLETVKELTRKKATINWARRGTMRLASKKSGQELYSFFASEGFLERLQVPPARQYDVTKPKRKRSSSAKEWTMMDPEGYKGSKPPMPAGQKTTMKVSGCGCVMLPLIGAMIGSGHLFKLGVFLGFLYIVLLVKRSLCHKG